MSSETLPPSVRQRELIEKIGVSLGRGVPGDWSRVVLEVKAVGSYAEAVCRAVGADGSGRVVSSPDDLQRLVVELRSVMYRSGAGTWFSMVFTVIATSETTGRVETRFDYDEMPAWHSAPVPVTYVEDLQAFPRDSTNMPGWLTEQVELARPEYPELVERLGIKFYREVVWFPDGREKLGRLFRREAEGDVKTDATFKGRDSKWHSSSDLMMALYHISDVDVRQVSPMDARAFIDKGWGAGDGLYGPMIVDAYERQKKGESDT